MRGLVIPDNGKKFMLKTDASNTGLGQYLCKKTE